MQNKKEPEIFLKHWMRIFSNRLYRKAKYIGKVQQTKDAFDEILRLYHEYDRSAV